MIILMACTTGTEAIVLDLKSLEQLPFFIWLTLSQLSNVTYASI